MPGTWQKYAIEVIGYAPEQNRINEAYVATKKIEQWLREGYGAREIARIWNQGHAGPCKSGTNRHGVPYNSCKYVQHVLALVSQ